MTPSIFTRRLRFRKLNDLYKSVDTNFLCYYCGDSASTYDHVPPLSYVDAIGTEQIQKDGLELIKVPSCHECNSKILNSRHLLDLPARVKAVYTGLQKRYRKLLSMPTWESDELDELGHGLQASIEGAVFKRKWIEDRLQFIEDVHNNHI